MYFSATFYSLADIEWASLDSTRTMCLGNRTWSRMVKSELQTEDGTCSGTFG